MNAKYMPHVDGIRAIAVLSVLLFHVNPSWLPGGFVGVDIFFVISGYLITRLIKLEIDETQRFDFKRFYIRRFKRLYPALLFVLLITFLVAFAIFSPTSFQRFGGALSSSIFSVSNIFFWLESDYFDTASQFKPLLHTWSLAVEEQFYLVWPLLIVLLYRCGTKIVLYSIFLIGIFSLLLNFEFGSGEIAWISKEAFPLITTWFENGKSTIFYNLPFRVFEFVIGALVVFLKGVRSDSRFNMDVCFLLGLILVVMPLYAFNDGMLFPGYYGLVPCVGTLLLIISGAGSRFNYILSNKVLVSVGLISYSLYLVHWPIIVFFNYLSPDLTLITALIILLLTFVIALLCHSFIEKPFRYQSLNSFKMIIMLALTSFLFIAGLDIYKGDGWAFRAPVNIEVAEKSSDYHKKYYGGEGYPYYGAVKTEESPDIIVLGDSHARHYAEGLYKVVAQPNDMALYIASGVSCLHLPSFTRTTAGSDWNNLCPEAFNKVVDFIKESKTPPLLVISHLWLYQLSNSDLLDINGERRKLEVNISNITEGVMSLAKLVGTNNIVVIGQVPTTGGVDLYDMFTRPRSLLSFFDVTTKYNKTEIKNWLVKFKSFNDDFGRELESNGIKFINPFDVFCDNLSCDNLDETGRLLYSDPEHLSKNGSKYLIKSIKEDLTARLKESRNITN